MQTNVLLNNEIENAYAMLNRKSTKLFSKNTLKNMERKTWEEIN